MKSIKILVLAIFSLFAVNTQAQMSIGVTGGIALPMGDFGTALNMGFGGGLVGKYMLNENMAVGANVGYIQFSTDLDGFSTSMMPITGLFEYYLGSGSFKPYLGADLGMYNLSVTVTYLDTEISASEMYFGFAPTAGFLYGINDNMAFNVNAKYHYVMSGDGSSTFLGVNLGLIYTLGK